MSDVKSLQDGTVDFRGGCDTYHDPNSILPNQLAGAVNLSFRRNVLSPRPRFIEQTVTFENKTIKNKLQRDVPYREIWRTGKFQALIPSSVGNDKYLLTIVNGFIFKINLSTLEAVLINEDPALKLNPNAPRINWCNANGKIVVFDYPAYPLIIDGEEVTRSSFDHKVDGQDAPQVPISALGTYNQNRLFVADTGVQFTAGDPVGNLLTPEAPITFTEVFTPSSPYYRDFYSLPVDQIDNNITAMGFIQQLDSSTGVGPMFVATANKVYFYQTNQPRANWELGQFGGLLLAAAGIVGPRAFVNVNSDLIFVSSDGNVHALSTARNDAKKWGNIPISREMNEYVKRGEEDLKKYTVVGYYDNRILVSVNQYRTVAKTLDGLNIPDYCGAGFIVLDTTSSASLLSESPPIWEGMWTGVNPMDVCTVEGNCYVMSKDGDDIQGYNALYFIDTEPGNDIVNSGERQCRSIAYTREYDFQNQFAQKREASIFLDLAALSGDIGLEVYRKPNHATNWLKYVTWDHKAPTDICGMPDDMFLNGIAPQNFNQLIFGDPQEEGCNPVTEEPYSSFRLSQYRITLYGNWILKAFKVKAKELTFLERLNLQLCNALPIVRIAQGCDKIYDWIFAENKKCQK